MLFSNDRHTRKKIQSSPNRSRTYDLPITSSDALPLSYRRLVGTKAIKLQYCAKVMQTNFDEFPGFSTKIRSKRNFGDISPHFRDTYCFNSANFRTKVRCAWYFAANFRAIIRSEFSSEISSIVALKFSRKVCHD